MKSENEWECIYRVMNGDEDEDDVNAVGSKLRAMRNKYDIISILSFLIEVLLFLSLLFFILFKRFKYLTFFFFNYMVENDNNMLYLLIYNQ